MFYLYGTPRSGTTLLAQCLSAHSKVIIPYETDFIVPMAFIFDRVTNEDAGREIIFKLITNSKGYATSLAEYLEPDAIYDVILASEYHPASILKKLYAKLAEVAGAELAGDKSPNDMGSLGILFKTECFPSDIKIIHMVRDVRDLMVSLKNTGWVSNLDSYPGIWSGSNLNLNNQFKNKSNYQFVRYEDLVANPKKELERLIQFLGYSFEEGMLDPDNRHQRYKDISVHANLYNPISSNSVNQYRKMLDKSTIKKYEKQAKKGLITFGYMKKSFFSFW